MREGQFLKKQIQGATAREDQTVSPKQPHRELTQAKQTQKTQQLFGKFAPVAPLASLAPLPYAQIEKYSNKTDC
jgi:hypothetical protein